MQVNIHGGNFEKGLKDLKRKMQRELIFRLMKMSRFYEPPSVKRVRKKQETQKRVRKSISSRRAQGY
ncbi:30S ribosomal protein S21 [Rickettsia endosymbiont of Cardiosporidium cionae]|uniref:30S ribosomal protein S21 n=1 Tax=Rickettsia endosymbiont of Cardiosporidium cionae TaxID=2777155 RepID=UPI0018937F8A|nr:30S ribosomal protein S21 [Rickettsia endosymbiont of Cardiosporidium cionae]